MTSIRRECLNTIGDLSWVVWVFLVLLVVATMGCTTVPEIQTVEVKVPVPVVVKCSSKVPAKPVWALGTLPAGADIDTKVKYALAEIEQRIAYETQVLAALMGCL